MRSSFNRTMVWVCGAFLLLFSAEFLVEWFRLGQPGMGDLSWQDVNNAKLVDILSPMARAYNNVLAMLIATIGLAIPLTANMHTPKLIDMFLRDRLNQFMLTAMAFGAANVLYVDYMIGPKFAPMWAFRVAVWGSMLGWAALVPYFFYVVRFLDPSNIIARLKDETLRAVEDVEARRIGTEAGQDLAHERLHQIGTIILKSLDRADRGVALEGIWALKRILDHYGERKGRMPEAWFKVDRQDFIGLSAEALELLNEERTFFELKVLSQMFLAYQNALSKTSDVISSISDANRVIAVAAEARKDPRALDVSIRYFNNFLREAIKKKDPHSIYDIFYQYRLLARDVREHPDIMRKVVRNIRYYADSAQAAGMPFIKQLAAFDLGYVVRRAYEVGSPIARELLLEVLTIEHADKAGALALVVKAKILIGGYLVEKGLPAEADLVKMNLADVPVATVARCEKDLLEAEHSFHEVTDRQVNLEWVQTERRAPVRAFCASLGAAP